MKEAILLGGPHHLKRMMVDDNKTRIVMLHNQNQTWYQLHDGMEMSEVEGYIASRIGGE